MSKRLCVLAIMLLLPITVSAKMMNYQGYLTTSTGAPVPDETYRMEFKVYSDSTGGTPLWTETHEAVTTSNGVFSLNLGSNEPIDDGGWYGTSTFDVFFEVSVRGEIILPRMRIVHVPQAMQAGRVRGDIETLPGELRLYLPDPGGASPDPSYNLVLKVDSLTSMFEMYPPEPGTEAQSAPSFQIKLDSIYSILKLHPPDPCDPEGDGSNGGGMQGTVSAEMVALNLMAADPCLTLDSANGIRLIVDPDVAKISIQRHTDGSYVNLSTNINPMMELNNPELGIVLNLGVNSDEEGIIIVQNLPSPGKMGDDSAYVVSRADASSASVLIADAWRGPSGGYNNSNVEISADSAVSDITLIGGYGAGGGLIKLTAENGGAKIGINTDSPSEALYVVGNIIATGNITALTETKYKTNINPLNNALDKVTQLNGYTYDLRRDEFPELKFTDKGQIGFLAEEVAEVVPEVVLNNIEGPHSVDYGRLTALLVEAVKEQQKTIEALEKRIDQLEN